MSKCEVAGEIAETNYRGILIMGVISEIFIDID
jgi:hypothetical protein